MGKIQFMWILSIVDPKKQEDVDAADGVLNLKCTYENGHTKNQEKVEQIGEDLTTKDGGRSKSFQAVKTGKNF